MITITLTASNRQLDGENNKVIYVSIKRNNNNNNNNNSKQSKDVDAAFAIIQMKELIEDMKNLQVTYQDVFNVTDTLPSNDTEKCDVLLKLNKNIVPA